MHLYFFLYLFPSKFLVVYFLFVHNAEDVELHNTFANVRSFKAIWGNGLE